MVLLVTAVTLGVTAANARQLLENVPLAWRPTSQVAAHSGVVDSSPSGVTAAAPATTEGGGGAPAVATPHPARRIQIPAFTDTRANPTLIGENREDADKGSILPVTTRDDVASWCAERVRETLKQLGFEVVDAGGDVVLSASIVRFFVVETSTYQGEVGLKIDLKSQDGTVLWSGVANGATTRFGRSYKLENYHEVISDSLLDAVQKLAEHPAFLRAIGGATVPSAAR